MQTKCEHLKHLDVDRVFAKPEIIDQATAIFGALSDRSRFMIVLSLLESDKTVNQLQKVVETSQSAVSHQLRILRDKGLVSTTRQGQSVRYSLADEHVAVLVKVAVEHASELFREEV